MTIPMIDVIARAKTQSVLSADDVLALRRTVWPDGKIDASEADAIFDLNAAIADPPVEWVDFFVEVVATYVVRQQAPVGYVDAAKADWLVARIDRDGRVESLGELTALVKILEDATNVPDTLKHYALRQIEQIVLTGSGPTRDGGTLDPGSITVAEVALLRRILFAQASDGPGMISRAEADLLFRIKDATLGQPNAPEWRTLFVQAIGNHLMAHSDYRALTRERAAELDRFMTDTRSSVFGFLGRMIRTPWNDAMQAARADTADTPDHDAAVARDRAIAPAERDWLVRALDADATRDPLEQALLDFIAAETRTCPAA